VRYACISVIALMLLGGYSSAKAEHQSAAESTAQSASKQEPTPEQIIQQFTQKETEFYEAWKQYTYTQTSSIRVVSVDGRPLERKEGMTIISEVVFNDDGTREVRTIRRSGRLRSVGFTEEDEEVLENINPFALTKEELPLYDLKYQGREKVDELECYVFSVKPKSIKKGRLYFEGKIWVDDLDLQVVRTIGKPVPQSRDNKFPEFETLRQVIDDKYWFPVWTHADSDLRFPNQTVHIEETITYDDYKKFRSDATIKFGAPNPSEAK
jgi:hypothetical protein